MGIYHFKIVCRLTLGGSFFTESVMHNIEGAEFDFKSLQVNHVGVVPLCQCKLGNESLSNIKYKAKSFREVTITVCVPD